MKYLVTLLLLCTAFQSVYAQDGTFCTKSTCYKQGTCYTSASIDSVTYTFATVHSIYHYSNVSVDLKITVYSPCTLPNPITATTTSTRCPDNCKRPFILLIHGGGFRVGCKKDLDDECREFARRGYVAATMDYRLGWVPSDTLVTCNNNFCVTSTSGCGLKVADSCKLALKDSVSFALYRALQDAHAAMRFIRHYSANINVDPNYIYIGGQSAGSVTAVNLTYVNQNELDISFPTAKTNLGKYDTSGNSLTDTFHIAGVYNNWGAVIDTAYIKAPGNKVPMISFHGTDDQVVPFGEDYFTGCTNYFKVDGSDIIYQRLTQKYPNLPVELITCKGGHGIFEGNPVTDSLSLYRIQKAVCFFRRVRQGETDTNYLKLTLDESIPGQITRHIMDSISPVDCDTSASINFVSAQQNVSSIAEEGRYKVFVANGSIACQYKLTAPTNVNITVYDITGRILHTFTEKQNEGIQQHQFPEKLQSSIYFVTMSFDDTKVFTQKIALLN